MLVSSVLRYCVCSHLPPVVYAVQSLFSSLGPILNDIATHTAHLGTDGVAFSSSCAVSQYVLHVKRRLRSRHHGKLPALTSEFPPRNHSYMHTIAELPLM